jgi:hypothetical protein
MLPQKFATQAIQHPTMFLNFHDARNNVDQDHFCSRPLLARRRHFLSAVVSRSFKRNTWLFCKNLIEVGSV